MDRVAWRDRSAQLATKNLSRIRAGDLKLGEPLRYSIYDQRGTLLLRQGVVVNIPAQIERLLAEGVFADEEEMARASPGSTRAPEPPPVLKIPAFLRAEDFCNQLKGLMVQIIRVPDQGKVTQGAQGLAREIQATCAEDPVPLVAALHVDHVTTPMVIHQLFGAVLAELVGKRAEMSEAERLSMVCAALTRDIGQAAFQHELDRIQGPLTESLKEKVRQHPRKSVEMLQRAGVTDAAWLSAVETHHERLNGTGYPAGAKGEQIGPMARLLAVCDTYSAMVKPRPYRPKGQATHTQLALREIFSDQGTTVDSGFAALLIKTIGVLPPGSIVRLKCGEVAIVRDTVTSLTQARVWTLYDRTQMPVLEPVPRDTSNPGHEIVGMAYYSECRSAHLVIKSLWLKGK